MTKPQAEVAFAHMALHGWVPAYGGMGTIGFWNLDTNFGVGVFYRETVTDPYGELVGDPTTLGQKFFAPVLAEDMPADILHKIAKYTRVPPI